MTGVCRLYHREAELQNSHIYPSFVIDYVKQTGSKFLRRVENPNKREQDGIKQYWLSREAEQLFSKREKWFAEKVFYPYLKDGQTQFSYDENLYYFSLSFLWRVLLLELEHPTIKALPFYFILQEVAEEWRLFLANNQYPSNFSGVNLFFSDHVTHHNFDAKGADYFFSRQLDGCVVANEKGTYIAVYGKFLKFIFWSIVKKNEEVALQEISVNPIGGTFQVPQSFTENGIFDFFGNRMKFIESLKKPSAQQQEKILQEILKDPFRFWSSEAGKAIYNDHFNLDKKINL
jgi:hypothetical protein